MEQRRSDRAALEAEIDRIRSLGLEALRKNWRSMFGSPPPVRLTKDIVARMICHRMQEEKFGGLGRETIRLLDGWARGKKFDGFNRRLKSGTVLYREYNGERHTVTVVPEGFIWRDTPYSSLSTIAHAITGTAWNGPRFFGLRSKANYDGKNETKQLRAKSTSSVQQSRANNKSAHRETRR